jgi:hypothetical protein
MLHRLGDVALLLILAACPQVQRTDIFPAHLFQSAAQSLGKERVVAIPLAQAAKVEVGLINCPMLCLAGERDLPECIRQMHTCYEQLHVHKKAQHLLTVAEGADAHCQINNPHLMHQVVIDWLDDVFAR